MTTSKTMSLFPQGDSNDCQASMVANNGSNYFLAGSTCIKPHERECTVRAIGGIHFFFYNDVFLYRFIQYFAACLVQQSSLLKGPFKKYNRFTKQSQCFSIYFNNRYVNSLSIPFYNCDEAWLRLYINEMLILRSKHHSPVTSYYSAGGSPG